jgi:hypothetical protein
MGKERFFKKSSVLVKWKAHLKILHVVTKGQNKKCACHMKGKIENMPITWKARKKNAYNMKLQCTNFLT